MDKSNVRILVLDDEPLILKLLSHALTKLGYTNVTACDNGETALTFVDAVIDPPNLILLDLNMPQMDGLEFVRKLVQHQYAGSLILVSGEDECVMQSTENLIHAHKITVLGHLRKPVSRDGLNVLLQKWSEKQPQSEKKKTYSADELRNAIKNKELINYYQPKVALASGEVVGLEALVRWLHPVDGLVLPDQFISLAEEHHLIDDLTRLVLVEAFKQIRSWRQSGLQLCVAINLSMDNLSTIEFADFVSNEAALEPAIDPQSITLELTESRLMQDARAPLEILTRLRMKHFRLSIDDFGTGNSSLTQLRNIPFDELKIDQSFVHGAWRDETTRVMYEVSLNLGKQLGLKVVAEGVEDLKDWEFVRNSTCDLAQGYFISQPMPAADLIDWIAKWKETSQSLRSAK
jgi:EAL domain-containing protein (putative c-di-GMP-specific phosphodiesterase class I)/AmiR/NasT family two-component response regulator